MEIKLANGTVINVSQKEEILTVIDSLVGGKTKSVRDINPQTSTGAKPNKGSKRDERAKILDKYDSLNLCLSMFSKEVDVALLKNSITSSKSKAAETVAKQFNLDYSQLLNRFKTLKDAYKRIDKRGNTHTLPYYWSKSEMEILVQGVKDGLGTADIQQLLKEKGYSRKYNAIAVKIYKIRNQALQKAADLVPEE